MKRRLLRKEEDSDPMSVVSNLFDDQGQRQARI